MSGIPHRIVLVDDDTSIRQLVREVLERDDPGVALVACSDGAELLTRLRELQPELVLLDLRMPKMSGPDVLEVLRARPEGRDVPVIFITGAPVVMTEEYRSLKVLGIIKKPFNIHELPEIIALMWQYQSARGSGAGDISAI